MSTKLSPWCLAKAAESLPEGTYRVAGRGPGPAVLGWLLGQYRFDRYKKEPSAKGARVLLTDEPARIDETVLHGRGDLPGPRPGQHPRRRSRPGRAGDWRCWRWPTRAARRSPSPATTRWTRAIRWSPRSAAPPRRGREPRLIELEHGDQRHPRIAIVGKGVCFDSGGLDLKPSSGMRLMKKDMGGAAHALALGAADHQGPAARPAASAHPGGRECGLRRRLPARRHPEEPQGPDRRDRQYRRRRPADPRRRADPGAGAEAGADPRLRDPDRRRARRARPGPPGPVRQ